MSCQNPPVWKNVPGTPSMQALQEVPMKICQRILKKLRFSLGCCALQRLADGKSGCNKSRGWKPILNSQYLHVVWFKWLKHNSWTLQRPRSRICLRFFLRLPDQLATSLQGVGIWITWWPWPLIGNWKRHLQQLVDDLLYNMQVDPDGSH